MLHATERRALDRFGLRVFRVDLHDPAVAVDLVLVAGLGAIETRVELVPGIAESVHRDSVARLLRRRFPRRVGRAEVSVEVLFAREIRAPRRVAVGAVVESAECLVAGGVRKQCAASSRTSELDRRVHVNAAVALVALERPALGAVLDVHHTDTMEVLRDAHLFQARRLSLADCMLGGAVFEVDCEHALAVVTEVVHAVVTQSDGNRLLR